MQWALRGVDTATAKLSDICDINTTVYCSILLLWYTTHEAFLFFLLVYWFVFNLSKKPFPMLTKHMVQY